MPLPCEREMQKKRGELTVAGEAIAAFRVALCRRIISFGWDESTKFGMGLLSTNTQIEPHDAPGTSVDLVQRGGALTAGSPRLACSSNHRRPTLNLPTLEPARKPAHWRYRQGCRVRVAKPAAVAPPAPGSGVPRTRLALGMRSNLTDLRWPGLVLLPARRCCCAGACTRT